MTLAKPSRTWRAAAPFGAIILATLAAYLLAIRGQLIWNDADYVTRPDLRPLHGLARIWFQLGATEQYYPVLHSAFWLEHRCWGDAVAGYHLANILLHAASACLLVIVLRRLAIPGAVWAGFLFALHPVEVESVAWISEQKNTLSTVFYLLAALFYLRWLGNPENKSSNSISTGKSLSLYIIATGFFILSLLSKSVTATLPAALLVVAWWRQGRLSLRRDVAPLAPWLVIGAASGLFSAWVERTYAGATGAHFDLTGLQRCLVAGRAVWFYLAKLLWPANLIFIYPRWRMDAASLEAWLYPLGVVLLAGALWLVRRRTRAPLAAFLFFVGTLFPTLGFLNVYAFVFSCVADHWQYLASLGVFALAAAAVPRLGRAGAMAAAAALGVLAVLTFRQCRHYRDLEGFYRTTLARNPDAWMVNNNLGALLLQGGRPAEALPYFRRAAELEPDYPEIHYNLGDALAVLRRTGEAIAEYEAALRLRPDYGMAQANLATLLLADGRASEAIPHFQQALRIFPRLAKAHYGLAYALAATGRLPEAIDQYEQSLRLEPDAPPVRNGLGIALARAGRLDEAIAEFEESLRLQPDNPGTHYDLGLALRLAGRTAEAAAQFREAARQPARP